MSKKILVHGIYFIYCQLTKLLITDLCIKEKKGIKQNSWQRNTFLPWALIQYKTSSCLQVSTHLEFARVHSDTPNPFREVRSNAGDWGFLILTCVPPPQRGFTVGHSPSTVSLLCCAGTHSPFRAVSALAHGPSFQKYVSNHIPTVPPLSSPLNSCCFLKYLSRGTMCLFSRNFGTRWVCCSGVRGRWQ